jgi:hypothetical protein
MPEIMTLEHPVVLSIGAVPLLVSVPVLVLLGLVVWGFWKCHGDQDDECLMRVYDQMVKDLLILSAFTLKIFWVYLLL